MTRNFQLSYLEQTPVTPMKEKRKKQFSELVYIFLSLFLTTIPRVIYTATPREIEKVVK